MRFSCLPAFGGRCVLGAAVAAGLGCAASRADAALLGVDFNNATTSATVTETGFQAFSVPNAATAGPLSQAFPVSDPAVLSGSINVTLAAGTTAAGTGNLLSRDRGAGTSDSGAFTYGELYRDLAIATGTNTTLVLQLAGLNPLTAYDVTLYAYDPNNGGTVTLNNITTGTATGTQTYTYTAGSVAANEQFGRTYRVTSTAAGTVAFTSNTDFNGSQGLLNGFQVSAVPEPASATTVGVIVAAGLLARRRRR